MKFLKESSFSLSRKTPTSLTATTWGERLCKAQRNSLSLSLSLSPSSRQSSRVEPATRFAQSLRRFVLRLKENARLVFVRRTLSVEVEVGVVLVTLDAARLPGVAVSGNASRSLRLAGATERLARATAALARAAPAPKLKKIRSRLVCVLLNKKETI